jgi:hypothetical protein
LQNNSPPLSRTTRWWFRGVHHYVAKYYMWRYLYVKHSLDIV